MKIIVSIIGGSIAFIGLLVFGFHIGGDNDYDGYGERGSRFYKSQKDSNYTDNYSSKIKDVTYSNRGGENQTVRCVTGGCSGELCLNSKNKGISSACEFKEEYRCRVNCKARNNVCSFDTEYERTCVSCIKSCEAENRGEGRELCYQSCFGK